jgi:hypothetical protein
MNAKVTTKTTKKEYLMKKSILFSIRLVLAISVVSTAGLSAQADNSLRRDDQSVVGGLSSIECDGPIGEFGEGQLTVSGSTNGGSAVLSLSNGSTISLSCSDPTSAETKTYAEFNPDIVCKSQEGIFVLVSSFSDAFPSVQYYQNSNDSTVGPSFEGMVTCRHI